MNTVSFVGLPAWMSVVSALTPWERCGAGELATRWSRVTMRTGRGSMFGVDHDQLCSIPTGSALRGSDVAPTVCFVADVALRRRRLACLRCEFTTRARYGVRRVNSLWRGLDLGRRKVQVRATLRRLQCPAHGVVTEAVPFARAGSRFTRDFENLVAYLATKTDKITITRLQRIDWDTVGRICERVVADRLDQRAWTDWSASAWTR